MKTMTLSLGLVSVVALCPACALKTRATASSSATSSVSTNLPSNGTVDEPPPPTDEKSGNPFAGATQAVNPDYVAKVEGTAKANPVEAQDIRKVEAIPTAVWLDSIASVSVVSRRIQIKGPWPSWSRTLFPTLPRT